MNQTIKQHFIPQCYLKQWDCGGKSIILNDPIKEVSYKRKIENVFFIKKLYSLILDDLNIIDNKDDLTKCFQNYIVSLNDKILSNVEILQKINDFDDFLIKKNEQFISAKEKKDLKGKFYSSFSNEIEVNYSKLECLFEKNIFSKDLYASFLNSNSKLLLDLQNLIFDCANNLYDRNPYIINFHQKRASNNFDFDVEFERIFKLIQKDCRKFIPICDLIFLKNNTNVPFYTSDIPVVLDLAEVFDENSSFCFKSLFYFPLSPNTAVRFSYIKLIDGVPRKSNDEFRYYFFDVSDENQVRDLNKKMIDNCSNYFVSTKNYYCKNGNSNFRFDFSKKNLRGIFKNLSSIK